MVNRKRRRQVRRARFDGWNPAEHNAIVARRKARDDWHATLTVIGAAFGRAAAAIYASQAPTTAAIRDMRAAAEKAYTGSRGPR